MAERRAYKVHPSREIPGAIIFNLHQTKGVTLEISALLACQKRMTIGWAEFIKLAIENGWNTRGLFQRCRNACKDAGYNDIIMSEIEKLSGYGEK